VRLPWGIVISARNYCKTYPLAAKILIYEDKEPPIRQTDSVRQGSEITSENDIGIEILKPYKGADSKYYKRVDFVIVMTVIGAALEFALICQGTKIGHSQVEPDLDDGS
jgi:hypothetical protein